MFGNFSDNVQHVKRKTVAGYIINLFMFVYLTIGVWVVMRDSVASGFLYLGIIALSFLCVAYFFCAKCACRLHACMHLWLGKPTILLPKRTPEPYTLGDSAGSLLYLVGLHALPQYWLWQNSGLFVIFWALAFATFFVGPLHACKGCQNTFCSFRKQ
jgi:hypothetical protein